VALQVDAAAPAVVASQLSVFAGSAVDVAATPEPSPSEAALPAVWVPDSVAWLGRVRAVDQAAFDPDALSLASSRVVLAVPEASAAQLGVAVPVGQLRQLLGPGGPLKLGVAEPRREAAGLAATMLIGEALATNDAELPALVRTLRGVAKATTTAELLGAIAAGTINAAPATEQAIRVFNAANPTTALAAVPLDPAGPVLDYPYAVRTGISHEVAQAAELFRAALLAGSGLSRAMLDVPAGVPDAALSDPARVQRALGLWTAANSPSRTLALLDVTSSMGNYQPTTSGGASRLAVMAAAAKGGLDLFATDSKVGLWSFASQHDELLPIGELTPARRAALDTSLTGANLSGSLAGNNRSELYDTLLAAYAAMKDGYEAARPNLIVVLTDGGDSTDSTLRAEKFKQDLQRLADPTKPIRVVLIGIGVGTGSADEANLRRIAETVGGGYFPLTSPEQIQAIFLKALLSVGAG
jgi:ABC-type molybdate transport system substrate-binding protein